MFNNFAHRASSNLGYFFLFFLLLSLVSQAQNAPLKLRLPTVNKALFNGKQEDFFMYTTRHFEGKKSSPWTGGTYGYSRNLKRGKNGEIIATRFHEGIDIKPVYRDRARRPKDIVRSIAPGKVVYINNQSKKSNYGKYVVVQHQWPAGSFYSLYAHLASISCKKGKRLKAGSALGKMGYTGRGINLTRAHLHLELNIMWHPEFDQWHASHYNSPNHHGKFNGINMSGLDITRLYLQHQKNPTLDLATFIQSKEVQYKVTVPRSQTLEICKIYPWLKKGDHAEESPSWEISFSHSTFPLAVEPSQKKVDEPTVTFVQPSENPHSYRSRGMLRGTGDTATLSTIGKRHIELVTGSFLQRLEKEKQQAIEAAEAKKAAEAEKKSND